MLPVIGATTRPSMVCTRSVGAKKLPIAATSASRSGAVIPCSAGLPAA
jgi:hypothetical protein